MAETYVLSDTAADKFANAFVNATSMSKPSYFKIAEGGWYIVVDTTKGQRDPVSTLDNIDVVSNPSRYTSDSLYSFMKMFEPGDVSFEATGIAKCRCFLDFDEANDDGLGNEPEFWELGIFDEDDVMVAYGTFPKETKNVIKQLQHIVRIGFGGV